MTKVLFRAVSFAAQIFVATLISTYIMSGFVDIQKAVAVGGLIGIGYGVGTYTVLTELCDAMNKVATNKE